MKTTVIRVTGRVQGVGFRAYTKRTARKLDIKGWVRNEPDGSVKIVAQGDNVEAFLENVEEGPRLSRVESVSSKEREEKEFDSFRIKR